jgi:uncharacterized membrane protein
MNSPETESTDARLQKLEDTVAKLELMVAALTRRVAGGKPVDVAETLRSSGAVASATPTRAGRVRPEAPPVVRPRSTRAPIGPSVWTRLVARGPQFWISRIGIALVLLAVVFLFDYAIEKGWLTPPIRVAFGVALGVCLTAIGLRVQRAERWFSQLRCGGASATWYITGFAAFQLLHVVSYPVAFAFMVVVTAFTLWMGMRQDEPVLGVLGALGGFGTPFLLYTAQGSIPALMAYSCLVLLGSSGIYLRRGWRSLLWTAVIGVACILLITLADVSAGERWALQAGIVLAWLFVWLVSVGREVLASTRPLSWPRVEPALSDRLTGLGFDVPAHGDLAVLTVAAPVGALFLSRTVWQSSDVVWGLTALCVALPQTAVATYLRRLSDLKSLASAHMVAAAVLCAAAVPLLFTEHPHIVLWAALALGLLYIGKRSKETPLSTSGHLLWAIVAIWLLQRLTGEGRPDTAVFNARGLSDLVVIVGFLGASAWVAGLAKWYQLAAHIGLLAWVWRELSVLPSGDALVTTTYGLYGLLLLAASSQPRKVGLATLLAAVAKLFLVDLERVDPFLRILLFLGFGAVFLTISYYYRDRLQDPSADSRAPES